jgi:hypothetical protein
MVTQKKIGNCTVLLFTKTDVFYFQDFIEVKPNEEQVRLVTEINKKLENEQKLDKDIEEIEFLTKALSNEKEIIDLESELAVTEQINSTEENAEFFKQICGLIQQKRSTTTQSEQPTVHRIESHVIEDAKHLLRLFGLPYLESPGEAEAQCAYV